MSKDRLLSARVHNKQRCKLKVDKNEIEMFKSKADWLEWSVAGWPIRFSVQGGSASERTGEGKGQERVVVLVFHADSVQRWRDFKRKKDRAWEADCQIGFWRCKMIGKQDGCSWCDVTEGARKAIKAVPQPFCSQHRSQYRCLDENPSGRIRSELKAARWRRTVISHRPAEVKLKSWCML